MHLRDVKKTIDFDKLIEGCLKNDRQCQQQLYDTFAPEMLAVCERYTKTKHEAEDVMIDGFVSVFSHLNQFEAKSSLHTWIYRIMVNAALLYLRKNTEYRIIQDLAYSPEIEDEDSSALNTSMTCQEIMDMLRSMPEDLKLIFNLRVFEEYKFKEISEELQIPENTVRVYFLRARKWVIEHIKIMER